MMAKSSMNKCTSLVGHFDLMAMAVLRGDRDGIAQCGMSRATSEATGRHHWAITRSILPRRPPGQQTNKQQSSNTPTLLSVLIAMAMRRYDNTRIV